MSPSLWVGGVITVLLFVGAITAIRRIGGSLREQVKRPSAKAPPFGTDVPPGLHRLLAERGIASPEALAAMSPMERELLFRSLARPEPPVLKREK
ncbi:MAG: hypothetical protein K2X99_05025 [Gemmatimonadaceae bacterium]|nr:hypothetical protein [Gemmatimonadaceae bacterium]